MSYQPVSQSTSYTCAVCNQSRTGWFRFQADTNLYCCNVCQPLILAGKSGANGGPNQIAVNANPWGGNSANQIGYGGGFAQAPFGNHWNASPSLNTPGTVFSTQTTAAIQQTPDPEQHRKDLLGGQ